MRTLRVARILVGIPLTVLAAKAGVSTKELARIERGQVVPRPTTLAALDRAFLALLEARLESSGA